MRLSIAAIQERAADRPPGHVADVLAHGVVDGEWLEISNEAMQKLRDRYRPEQSTRSTVSAVGEFAPQGPSITAAILAQPALAGWEVAIGSHAALAEREDMVALRENFLREAEALGESCSSCQKTSILRKYQNLVKQSAGR